jgi:hypothetical protein
MKKFMERLAWFTYRYSGLHLTIVMIGTVFVAGGIIGLISLLAPNKFTDTDIETAKTLVKVGLLSILVLIFLAIGFFAEWEKNEKIAKHKAQKILKENHQLNPPLDNHVELVKWIRAYERLPYAKEDLAMVIEQLNKLPEFEEHRKKLETEIKNLKSKI